MGKTSTGVIVRIVALVLKPFLNIISPMLLDLIEDAMCKVLEKARETENPIDDIFVEFLFKILGINIPEE